MITITKGRLLTIKQWRETYGPGSNVVLPAEEAEELARIALVSLEAEPVAKIIAHYPLGVDVGKQKFVQAIGELPDFGGYLFAAPPAPIVPEEMYWQDAPVEDSSKAAAYATGWNACRAAILHSAEPVSQAYKLNALDGNSPVTPDGWISCSERMPNDKQYVWCWGKSYGWTECDTFEGYYDCSRNKWWAVTDDGEEPASKVTHWIPLPEPPQEVK
ncbi:DUF551 domain-containing protein [Escherichia coli]|uniref:DUF551 domain-containing protein n=2 Tax=Escherichia coli TaxID=562 RepID=UPI000DF173D6|nr:DUF551 domain-containing protein [Escherichia coli]HAH1515728.1 DUF551 domain-containing protein [Escherichia coli]HAH9036185.1 DUF551 domain-containing protein [Escherichia coli]HAM4715484.1 DUF551 domain-containing protein [Escherichia coli]